MSPEVQPSSEALSFMLETHIFCDDDRVSLSRRIDEIDRQYLQRNR